MKKILNSIKEKMKHLPIRNISIAALLILNIIYITSIYREYQHQKHLEIYEDYLYAKKAGEKYYHIFYRELTPKQRKNLTKKYADEYAEAMLDKLRKIKYKEGDLLKYNKEIERMEDLPPELMKNMWRLSKKKKEKEK